LTGLKDMTIRRLSLDRSGVARTVQEPPEPVEPERKSRIVIGLTFVRAPGDVSSESGTVSGVASR
jgi:hypothetical protein